MGFYVTKLKNITRRTTEQIQKNTEKDIINEFTLCETQCLLRGTLCNKIRKILTSLLSIHYRNETK